MNCDMTVYSRKVRKGESWWKQKFQLLKVFDDIFSNLLVKKTRLGRCGKWLLHGGRVYYWPLIFERPSRDTWGLRIVLKDSYLVDPASSHMLVSKIKPCMSKYKQIHTVKLRMAH